MILLEPRGLARPPWIQEFQDALPSLSKVLPNLLCLQASMESEQCPGRSEAGQRSVLLILKPEIKNSQGLKKKKKFLKIYSATLCLLIGKLGLFNFKLIIDSYGSDGLPRWL